MSFDKEIILGYAKAKIKKLKKGETFNIYDIFNGYSEYDKLTKNDKLTIGKLIRNEIDTNNFNGVSTTGKKKNNRVEYIKN